MKKNENNQFSNFLVACEVANPIEPKNRIVVDNKQQNLLVKRKIERTSGGVRFVC